MKLVPTASQTVGPFFSIGLAPLCQDAASFNSTSTIMIRGSVFDCDGKPIPDAVLEFWRNGEFARVATTEEGAFSVILNPLPEQTGTSGTKHFEVLIFMRGLLKPVYTRVYLADAETLKSDPALEPVPPDRVATLVAKRSGAANQYEWDIYMQGENETVFFEY
jgi:protocatechuate 3,4-dioxygenase, alpha subunit